MAAINTDEPAWAERCKNIQCRACRLKGDNLTLFGLAAHMGCLWISIFNGRLLHCFARSTPKETSPGYYSVSPVNDSVFPRLIKWSATAAKSGVQKHNSQVVIIPLFPSANPILPAYFVWTGVDMAKIMQRDVTMSGFVFHVCPAGMI